MTKMKSKKMTKSTFAIIIMAIAMVALLAFGGTYAYFTATAQTEVKSDVKTAMVQLKRVSQLSAVSELDIVPGAYIYGTHEDHTNAFEQIELTQDQTSVDVFVFIRVTAYAVDASATGDDWKAITINNTGADTDDAATDDDESVLKLIRPTGTAGTDYNESYEDAWVPFASPDDVQGFNVFYFDLKDGGTLDKFNFKLQFDERVHADNYYDVEDQEYREVNNTSVENIMGINVILKFEYAAIQQIGFVPVDGTAYDSDDIKNAYNAIFNDERPIDSAIADSDRTDQDSNNPAGGGSGT